MGGASGTVFRRLALAKFFKKISFSYRLGRFPKSVYPIHGVSKDGEYMPVLFLPYCDINLSCGFAFLHEIHRGKLVVSSCPFILLNHYPFKHFYPPSHTHTHASLSRIHQSYSNRGRHWNLNLLLLFTLLKFEPLKPALDIN